MNIRRAIAWASAGQYAIMGINFVTMLVIARLLTPAEFGVAAMGGAILGIAEAIREIAGGNFIITERDLTQEKIRSTVTVSMIATLAVIAIVMFLAGPLATYYATPALVPYLSVAMIGYLSGPLLYPQQALITRAMAFDRLAIITLTSTCAGAATSILLTHLGFSSLSLAWGSAAASLAATVCVLAISRNRAIFIPSLSEWRAVLRFGIHSSTSAVLWRVNDALPMLIIGRSLDTTKMAIMQRAVTLSFLPERTILTAVGSVALPAFAQEGRNIKSAYLKALALISVVHWPAMIMFVILAPTLVELLLGHQWLEVTPLLRILCASLIIALPISLQYPVLSASNGVHLVPRLIALQTLLSLLAIAGTARHGLDAAAWSMFVVSPVNAVLSLVLVRRHIGFHWTDLGRSLGASIIVTAATAAGPLAVLLAKPNAASWSFDLLSAAVGGLGWLIGICVTDHPIWKLIKSIARGSK